MSTWWAITVSSFAAALLTFLVAVIIDEVAGARGEQAANAFFSLCLLSQVTGLTSLMLAPWIS